MITRIKIYEYIAKIVAGLIILALVVNAGDDIEGALFPVTKDISFQQTSRTHDTVCWELKFIKLRVAKPFASVYSISGDSLYTKTMIWAYDPKTLRNLNRSEAAPKSNNVVTYNRCAIIPFNLRSASVLYVSLLTYYDVDHGLWKIKRYVASRAMTLPASN